MDLNVSNQLLDEFAQLVKKNQAARKVSEGEKLKVGVDLGTSSIVLAVLDHEDNPIYGNFQYADVVRDGIVVNYIESVQILKKLKAQAEEVLGVELLSASGAIPPGTGENSQKIVANVIGDAGFIPQAIVDEPTAAAKFLHLDDGSVIDVGGGTTGISNFQDGQQLSVFDEPTGGFHMSLVLAGAKGITVDEAELLKREAPNEKEIFGVIRPVAEKMASISKQYVVAKEEDPVLLVGGATNFTDFIPTFTKVMKRPVVGPHFPQFVTPLGIAMYDQGELDE
ncbi:ethanolamine utilization protein EutJ [Vagococcus intermedius]|uniref:Ethanolamine utilization protein EutJ n=1 Tax=Vagococcus intermedius TaxID=2991418 RepID=A0AAF0I6P7_9ENTE|nr:ethanolamine utilization protein EutJ [Vagococcus intermedius]WEG72511.1 ethanolamine utilization protein EutJ [Vagococcus intermedius]WEG74598.1 ethanolamine utilization protein EutJ [Vagococcus intermedius]